MIGIDLKHALVDADRLAEAAQALEHLGPADERLDIIRRELARATEVRLRLGVAPLRRQRGGQAHKGGNIVRFERQRRLSGRHRRAVATTLGQADA